MEPLGWGVPFERHSWAIVELSGNMLELFGRVVGEVRPFREPLQRPVRILFFRAGWSSQATTAIGKNDSEARGGPRYGIGESTGERTG